MKSGVAIALIIGGVVLIAMPPLSDVWQTSMIAWVMQSKHDNMSVALPGEMDGIYRFACWLMGAAMIGIAVVASVVPALLQPRTLRPPG